MEHGKSAKSHVSVSDLFSKMFRMQNLSREMVMEYQEMVMDKSW